MMLVERTAIPRLGKAGLPAFYRGSEAGGEADGFAGGCRGAARAERACKVRAPLLDRSRPTDANRAGVRRTAAIGRAP